VAAVLLADEHDERRTVHAGGGERRDRVAEPGRRVQERERGVARADGVARGHADDGPLVQREHEAQIVREPGQERHLGRAGVREDRRQPGLAQDAERRLAHGARPRAAAVPLRDRHRVRPARLGAHGRQATPPASAAELAHSAILI
jgi:hypothetical protein